MPTLTTTRKRDWTLTEWQAFTARCRAVRDDLAAVGDTFKPTPGLLAPTVDAYLAVGRRLYAAMDKLQSLIVAQHPEEDWTVLELIHEPQPARTVARREKQPLGRDEWLALGNRIKAVRQVLTNLGMELQAARGGTKALQGRFFKVVAQLDRFKCRLDDLVCRQHPDWPETTRVFYGPML